MCGIFGWQWVPKRDALLGAQQRHDLAVALAALNDSRGGDSWGLVTRQGTQRGLGLLSRSSDAVATLARAGQVLAHTRLATTGDVTLANAHPLRSGRILGAHNGMLSNDTTLNIRHGRTCAVDSEHIFAHLDEGLPLSEIQGYGAAWWVEDTKERSPRLVRFTGGTLAVGSAKGIGVVFSSVEAHLKIAAAAAGVSLDMYQELEAGRHYILSAGELWSTENVTDLSPMDTKQTYRFADWRSILASETGTEWDDADTDDSGKLLFQPSWA